MKPFTFATGIYSSGDWESASLVPALVIDALARYTTLDLNPAGVNVRLDSDDLFEFPFVFLTGHLPVFFTIGERRNLVRFVDRGGFLFVDDHNHDIDGVFHQTMTNELTKMFGKLTRIPNDHAVYSAFFQSYRGTYRHPSEEGPPITSHELNGWGDNLIHEHLDGVMRDDRIDVLYSNKDYSSEWSISPERNELESGGNHIAKFAVNIVVYALSR